jgi:hypothetical protein
MSEKLREIKQISITAKSLQPGAERPSAEHEVRDRIAERIRHIAGKDSIERITPLQHQGDHREQDIVFDMGEASYQATVRYNNTLTEGWVSELRKYPRKC